MARDDERLARAGEDPIVGGLPEVPGIGVAMRLKPELGLHLRGLADELLVNDYPGATISRFEREAIATAVSASNDCFFCMDSHAEHAAAVLELTGQTERSEVLDAIKLGRSDGLDDRMTALLHIARTVARAPRTLSPRDVAAATDAGATDADVQLAVLIAAGFSMYNRLVDGFRARTPGSTEAYRPRAAEIAERGYSAPPAVSAGPRPS